MINYTIYCHINLIIWDYDYTIYYTLVFFPSTHFWLLLGMVDGIGKKHISCVYHCGNGYIKLKTGLVRSKVLDLQAFCHFSATHKFLLF